MKIRNKKILIIALVLALFLVAGVFVALFGKQDVQKIKDNFSNNEQTTVAPTTNGNILLNSNFALNSSGVVMFNKDNIKSSFVDNWQCDPGEDVVFTSYQVPEGIYVRNEGTASLVFYQDVAEGVKLYGNKEVTLTISVDGVVYSKTGVLTSDKELVLNVYSGAERISYTSVALFINSGKLSVSIKFMGGANFTLNWVKLELGNVFTGYSAE